MSAEPQQPPGKQAQTQEQETMSRPRTSETALEIAKRLRKMLCGYVGDRCDCKYLPDSKDVQPDSEQTGCCELRKIIGRLERGPP